MTWWHEREPNRLSDLRRALADRYPDLTLSVIEGFGDIHGSFPIIHEGVELDRFQVRIVVPPEFPREIPVVYEKSGRIPHDANWHTFDRGALCVIVPEDWLLDVRSRSLLEFLDGPLRNFFIGHALAEAGQPRPMGERGHGSTGLFQAYGEMLGVADTKAIPRYLDVCSAKKLKRHWKCPCGSGRRLVECHRAEVEALRRRVPRWIAGMARDRLTTQLRNEQVLRAKLAALKNSVADPSQTDEARAAGGGAAA
jgi:hypothetical protein